MHARPGPEHLNREVAPSGRGSWTRWCARFGSFGSPLQYSADSHSGLHPIGVIAAGGADLGRQAVGASGDQDGSDHHQHHKDDRAGVANQPQPPLGERLRRPFWRGDRNDDRSGDRRDRGQTEDRQTTNASDPAIEPGGRRSPDRAAATSAISVPTALDHSDSGSVSQAWSELDPSVPLPPKTSRVAWSGRHGGQGKSPA